LTWNKSTMSTEAKLSEGEVLSIVVTGIMLLFSLFLTIFNVASASLPSTVKEELTTKQRCEAKNLTAVHTSRLNFCVDDKGQMFLPSRK